MRTQPQDLSRMHREKLGESFKKIGYVLIHNYKVIKWVEYLCPSIEIPDLTLAMGCFKGDVYYYLKEFKKWVHFLEFRRDYNLLFSKIFINKKNARHAKVSINFIHNRFIFRYESYKNEKLIFSRKRSFKNIEDFMNEQVKNFDFLKEEPDFILFIEKFNSEGIECLKK